MFEPWQYAVPIVFWLAVLIGVFLLFRKFWWWYFGIDRMVRSLESIDASLRQLPAVRKFDHQGGRRSAKVG